MDFGKTDDIDNVDFTLPGDPDFTLAVLKEGKKRSTAKCKLYSGCAKWGRKEWVGKLYPEGVKEKDFLQYYVKHFNSIELNATHYRIFPEDTISKWRDTAGKGFKFCPKYPRSISHIRRLKNAEKETERFMKSVSAFGDKLGPCLLLLPDNFTTANMETLEKYLQHLPPELDTFVELRHKNWYNDAKVREELFAMLRENNAGSVITDTSGRRDVLHMYLTKPVAFIRFTGNDLHPTDYTRLDAWAKKLEDWKKKGLREAYFFLHQHEERDSPELADYIGRQLGVQK